MAKCLIDGCDGEAKSRGLCTSCYSSARLRVKSGVASWDLLEKMGLALKSTISRDRGSAFADAFNAQAESLNQANVEADVAGGSQPEKPKPSLRQRTLTKLAEEQAIVDADAALDEAADGASYSDDTAPRLAPNMPDNEIPQDDLEYDPELDGPAEAAALGLTPLQATEPPVTMFEVADEALHPTQPQAAEPKPWIDPDQPTDG